MNDEINKISKKQLKALRTQIAQFHRYSDLAIKDIVQQLQNKYLGTKSLLPFGYKAFSQSDEDGIIIEIFNRIGTLNKVFVEFGAGNGLQNNTLLLLFQEWKGLWIEADEKHIENIREGYKETISRGQLILEQAFITKENINHLISKNIKEKEIDLLSVDIDGNDYYVWDAIDWINPRVVVIEYNAKFPPPVLYCMKYNPDHSWDKTDNSGASIKFLENKFKAKGYSLVCCNLSGVNAFFVRDDLVADKFYAPFTAEHHYMPVRFFLGSVMSGHPASYDTLENRLAEGD